MFPIDFQTIEFRNTTTLTTILPNKIQTEHKILHQKFREKKRQKKVTTYLLVFRMPLNGLQSVFNSLLVCWFYRSSLLSSSYMRLLKFLSIVFLSMLFQILHPPCSCPGYSWHFSLFGWRFSNHGEIKKLQKPRL